MTLTRVVLPEPDYPMIMTEQTFFIENTSFGLSQHIPILGITRNTGSGI